MRRRSRRPRTDLAAGLPDHQDDDRGDRQDQDQPDETQPRQQPRDLGGRAIRPRRRRRQGDESLQGRPLDEEHQQERDGAEQRKALAPLRARLARCDKRLQELAAKATELDALLADPALYGPEARARQLELTTQRARVAQEVDQVEGEWLELSEELERAQAAG